MAVFTDSTDKKCTEDCVGTEAGVAVTPLAVHREIQDKDPAAGLCPDQRYKQFDKKAGHANKQVKTNNYKQYIVYVEFKLTFFILN